MISTMCLHQLHQFDVPVPPPLPEVAAPEAAAVFSNASQVQTDVQPALRLTQFT